MMKLQRPEELYLDEGLEADELPPVTAANMDQFRETDFTLCLGNVLGVIRAEGRYGIRRDELIASVAHNLRAVAYAIRLLWTLGHVRLEGGRVYT